MITMILGVFIQRIDAEDAVNDLQAAGYNAKDISLILKDPSLPDEGPSAALAAETATGATTGGVIGAIAGLLVGIGAIVVPGVGALFIAGPITTAFGLVGPAAATVTGAVTGILAGGLIGALVSLGIPANEAKEYETKIKEGGILIAVPTKTSEDEVAKDILEDHGAQQIKSITTDAPVAPF